MTACESKAIPLIALAAVCLWSSCVVHVTSDDQGATATAPRPIRGDMAQAPPRPTLPAPGAPPSDAELCTIRDAIVSALRASPEPWAASLADRTAGGSCAFDGGNARIAQWSALIEPCAANCPPLRFLWREEGMSTPAHAAEVVREGNTFRCVNLGQFRIVPATD